MWLSTCGGPHCTPLSAPSKPGTSLAWPSQQVSSPGAEPRQCHRPPLLRPHFGDESAACLTSG